MDSNIYNYKPIFLNEIDTSKDQILRGYYLTVTSIDIPTFGFTSVSFLIQDKNKDIHELSIYNLNEKDEDVETRFNIGTQFEIYNPYMRIGATDGKARIRVDDPESIKIIKISQNNCRVCLKENSCLYCSICHQTNYCSKECQILDWKILNHKGICQKY